MNQNTDILHEAKRLRLLAAALELQHFTRGAANVVPITGTDRVIAIGTPAQVRKLLGVADAMGALPARAKEPSFANDGREPDWEAYAAAEQADCQAPDQVDSEGGHHD